MWSEVWKPGIQVRFLRVVIKVARDVGGGVFIRKNKWTNICIKNKKIIREMGVWDGEREVSLGKQKFDKKVP